jgi:hypothetical protein
MLIPQLGTAKDLLEYSWSVRRRMHLHPSSATLSKSFLPIPLGLGSPPFDKGCRKTKSARETLELYIYPLWPSYKGPTLRLQAA